MSMPRDEEVRELEERRYNYLRRSFTESATRKTTPTSVSTPRSMWHAPAGLE